MKISTLIIISFLLSISKGFGQYNFIIDSLSLSSKISPKVIEGWFEKRTEIENGKEIEYYDFSNSEYNFCYYPKQKEISCGYFVLNNQVTEIEGVYPHNLGCDLDYGSFEFSKLNIGNKNYLILTCIRYGSGATTRNVYCNLFDITNPLEIYFYPLWSIYGSSLCFGDYNNDNLLDFLEIRYDQNSKSSDLFKLNISTLIKSKFEQDEGKYIIFKREFQDNGLPLIIQIENTWRK